MRWRLTLLATIAALPAWAQEMAPPPASGVTPPAVSGAVTVLVRQAERWLEQNRPDLAAAPIERALAAEPENPRALAVAARLELARGNQGAAAALGSRLERAGATAEAAEVQTAIRGSSIDRTALEEARRLARDGRANAAVQRYRALFGNQPPPEPYALEFYQALAGSDGGRAEGLQNLERLASRPGATPQTRLAFAQTQTFNPATRADGITRLRALAEIPDVATDARRAWSAAIGFAGGDPAVLPDMDAFLQRFPDDAEMRRRADALRRAPVVAAAPPDPDAAARQAAFQRLEAGALTDSARQFEALIRNNPNDADALGGLGVIRLREGNAEVARGLLERAIAADPAGGRQWQRALDAASYGGEVANARAQLRRGDAEGAEATARRAALRDVTDRSEAEILLGEIALRRGDPATAESRFRAVLARRPDAGAAQTGLNAAIRAQGRIAAPAPSVAPGPAPAVARGEPREPREPTGPQVTGDTPPLPASAEALRNEAARVANPEMASALLRNAMAQAPDNPWVRLDLARSLRRQGRAGEGRALVEELAGRVPTPDSAYAAALLAQEDSRFADADAFLARIPPNRRSPDMARLAQRLRSQRDVAAAAALFAAAPFEGRTRLLLLAARPDPTGGTAAAVIRAFGDANDRAGAAEAGRVAQVANASQPAARVAIAGALLGVGLEAESVAMAAEIEAGGASPEIRRDLAALRAGAAIRASDRLNEAGDQAGAFERLRPALANADNADAQLALARLFVSARQPAEALRVAEAALARDPRNIDTRRATIEAAIAAGNRPRAEALLREGGSLMPGDARLLLLQSRLARDGGDVAQARALLDDAARQRAAELGPRGTAPGVPLSANSGNPFSRTGPTTNPLVPTDRLTREIQQDIARLRDEAGPTMVATGNGRMRSGDSGLDRLSEVTARVEALTAVPAIGGRVTASIEPVAIDAGSLSNAAQARQRFGTAALNPTNFLPPSPESSAAGVALGVLYTRGDYLRADVGSTPIGFPTANIVGGLEVAPRLTESGIRLRFGGERRAMNDSLLSYAGVADPRTGINWGPVLRTGGRGQIEFPLGRGFGYIGGGYSQLEGDGVASNSRMEGGAGMSVPVWRGDDGSEISTGVDLVYLAYEKNLRYFTLGHGGYFSPQQYTALNVPLDFRARNGDFSYRVGASVGYAAWREDAAPYFPNDRGLQAQLEARSAANAGTTDAVSANYRAQSQAGFVGGLRLDLDYALSDSLSIGSGLRYDKASDFDETRFQLRLRNRF